MTSGLFDYQEDAAFVKARSDEPDIAFDPQDLLKIAFAHAPYFAPGTGFHYSNTNTVPRAHYPEGRRADGGGRLRATGVRAARASGQQHAGAAEWSDPRYSPPAATTTRGCASGSSRTPLITKVDRRARSITSMLDVVVEEFE